MRQATSDVVSMIAGRTDLDSVMEGDLSNNALVTTVGFAYSVPDSSEFGAVLDDLRSQASALKDSLSDVEGSSVTFHSNYYNDTLSLTEISLSVSIRIQFPAHALPADFRSRLEAALPAIQTREFISITPSLERQKTQAELDAEAAKARKDREQANAVFEPVRYFTFSSAVSDYATSIRYLMEIYYEKS